MKLIDRIVHTRFYQEYAENLRLQWLVLAVVAIVTLSFAKKVYDTLDVQRQDVQTEVSLLAKLTGSSQREFDASLTEAINDRFRTSLQDIPGAASSSTAEAAALQEIDTLLGNTIQRKRVNLIGSQQLVFGNTTLWEVRLEVVGQLRGRDFIPVLSHFDNSALQRRVVTVQYSPNGSNGINLVVDLLFRQEDDA